MTTLTRLKQKYDETNKHDLDNILGRKEQLISHYEMDSWEAEWISEMYSDFPQLCKEVEALEKSIQENPDIIAVLNLRAQRDDLKAKLAQAEATIEDLRKKH